MKIKQKKNFFKLRFTYLLEKRILLFRGNKYTLQCFTMWNRFVRVVNNITLFTNMILNVACLRDEQRIRNESILPTTSYFIGVVDSKHMFNMQPNWRGAIENSWERELAISVCSSCVYALSFFLSHSFSFTNLQRTKL